MTAAKNKGLGVEGIRRVEAALLSSPSGIDSAQAAAMTGYRRSSAAKALILLAAAGKAAYIRTGHGLCTWFHAKHKVEMAAMQAENARRISSKVRVRVDKSESYARFLAFEDAPIHRIVPASEAAPIGPVGPNSVWRIAA